MHFKCQLFLKLHNWSWCLSFSHHNILTELCVFLIVWHCMYFTSFQILLLGGKHTHIGQEKCQKIKELTVEFEKGSGNNRKKLLDSDKLIWSDENLPWRAGRMRLKPGETTQLTPACLLNRVACATVKATIQWPVLIIKTAGLNGSAEPWGSVCLDIDSHSKICTGILIMETGKKHENAWEKPRRRKQLRFPQSSTAHTDALLLTEHRRSCCPAALC